MTHMDWRRRLGLALAGTGLLLLVHAFTSMLGTAYYVSVDRVTYKVAVEPVTGTTGVAVSLGLALAALAYSLDMSRGMAPLLLPAALSLAALAAPPVVHLALVAFGVGYLVRLWGASMLPFLLLSVAGASLARLAVSLLSSPWQALPLSHLYHNLDFLSVVLAFGIFLAPVLARPAKRYLSLLGVKLRAPEGGWGGSVPQRALLAGGIAAALLVSSLPYSPFLNPLGLPVQVDSVFYYSWVLEAAENPMSIFDSANGSRPLYLAVLYMAYLAGASPDAIAKLQIIPLYVLYTFAVYRLALAVTGDGRVAGLAAVLAPLSPMGLGFIYGGFQANLAALSMLMLAFAALYTSRVGTAILLAGAAIWVHPWTWAQYVAGMGALALLRREMRRAGIVFLSAMGAVAALREAVGMGVLGAMGTVSGALEDVPNAPLGLVTGYAYFIWGAHNDWAFMSTVLAGIGGVAPLHPLIVASLAPYLAMLGSPGTFIRLFLNLPLEVPAAYALSRCGPLVASAFLVYAAAETAFKVVYAVPDPGLPLPWLNLSPPR